MGVELLLLASGRCRRPHRAEIHYLAGIGRLLPRNDVRGPQTRAAVLGVRHEDVMVHAKYTVRFLEKSNGETSDLVRVLIVNIGAAVAAEEAGHSLRCVVDLKGSVDVEFRTGGQVEIRDEEQAGLMAASVAMAEGHGHREGMLLCFEGASYLPASTSKVHGAKVF